MIEGVRAAHTVEQVRAAEADLMARVPEGALMQRAAAGLAAAVADLLGSVYGRRVTLLVGGGNNGGDALWAGAMLARRGAYVEAVLLTQHVHEEGLRALRQAGGRVAARAGGTTEVVIDGIVGIGGRPGLTDEARAALAAYDGVPVVAVDVPSGVDVDTGETPAPHVTADVTVTFGTHKIAHLADPAASACGAVHLVDLGLDLPAPALESLQTADVTRLLPRPDRHAQKYSRGVVGFRTGSADYPGAAVLGVSGAVSLAGMVRYDGGAADAVRAAHPEVVVGAGRVQAWVVGSGGGGDAEEALRRSLEDDVPLVVDADALAHVGDHLPAHAVLTPHAGELARMTGAERADIEAAPLRHVTEAAERYGCVVLLKGAHTLVAQQGRPTRSNATGNAWLATAGSGDVLAGVIGALLATGLDPFDAASVGAWLHGAAASYAGRGGPITARAVADAVAPVVGDLLA